MRELTKGAERALATSTCATPNAVREMVDNALTRPADSAWWDERIYKTHVPEFSRPSWSLTTDYAISEVNAQIAWDKLKGYGAEIGGFGHWTYSSFDCINVPLLDNNGDITACAVKVYELQDEIRNNEYLDWDAVISVDNALQMWVFYDATSELSDNERGQYYAYLQDIGAIESAYSFIDDTDWKEYIGEDYYPMNNVDIPLDDIRELMRNGEMY